MTSVTFGEQKDAYGQTEKVNLSMFSIQVVCHEPGCFQIRYIRPQDRSQVKYCKPHAKVARDRYRAEHMKRKRSDKR